MLKSLSGGEKISARFLHQEFFEFMPEFKIFLSANHLPNVRGGDKGIWRRLKLVPFNTTIPEDRREQDFFKKRLEPELEGILAWAVQGALDWNQDGLTEPQAVKAATQEYREEMDTLSQFIDERYARLSVGTKGLSGKQVFAAYKSWAEEQGYLPLADNRFGREMKTRGLPSKQFNGIKYYPLADKEQYQQRLAEEAAARGKQVVWEDDITA